MKAKDNSKRILDLAIHGLKAEIAALEIELAAISKGVAVGVRTLSGRKRRSRLSRAARKAISLAQKARWARRRGPVGKVRKKTRKLSAAARQKLSRAAKARWARHRAGKK